MAPTNRTLLAIARLENNQAGAEGYEQLLKDIVAQPPSELINDLNAYIDRVVLSHLGLVQTRPLVDSFAITLGSLSGPDSNDVKIQVGEHSIELLQEQGSSFEEQNGRIRQIMAAAYEADEDYSSAVKILSGIITDSSTRKFTNEELVRHYVHLTRLLLEDDDTTAAEAWLNKAKNLIYLIEDKELKLHFSLSQARIMDSRRQFLLAAQNYLEISYNPIIAEEERAHTLGMAIKCGILSPAGPARSRMLGRLYKDDRSSSQDVYGILEKMYFERIISPQEGVTFAEGLMPHQLAKTSDGNTVVAKAIIDHNIVAVSKLYSNISFCNLGVLLGLPADKAEDTVAKMIEQGRLTASLDQVEDIVYFEDTEPTGETSKKSDGVVGKELKKYDANIQGLAEAVEKAANALQAAYPDFVADNLVAA